MLEPGDRPASNCPHGPPRATCTGPHRAIVRPQPDPVASLWRLSRRRGRSAAWFLVGYSAAVLAVTATASMLVELIARA